MSDPASDSDGGSAEDLRRSATHHEATAGGVPNPAGELAAVFGDARSSGVSDPDGPDGVVPDGQLSDLKGADRDSRDGPPDEEELREAAAGEDSNCVSRSPLRCMMTARALLVFLCCYVVLQTMAVTGLFASSLSTIERRYGISSTTAGAMSSVYDAGVLSTTWAVAHYGGRGRPLRWLGVGLLLIGVGSLLFASPQVVGGEYNYPGASSREYCLAGPLDPLVGDCSGSPTLVVAVFFVAQFVIALGASPLYTLAPAYLDSVVKARHLPVYLGTFFACAALGPALGFTVQGFFLDEWVDGSDNRPDDVEPGDPEWVGAWWQGYVVVGFFSLLLCVPFFLYPRWLPRTRHIRRRLRRQAREAEAAAAMLASRGAAAAAGGAAATKDSLGRTLRALAANRTFVLNCLGQASESFMVSGFSSFMPKAAESVFRLTPSQAAFSIGAVLVPGAAGGIFFGGWLMKRLRATTGTAARSTFVIASVSFAFMATFYIGCGPLDLAGLTRAYPAGGGGGGNFTAACNLACECDPDKYRPVCGSDGVTYFSACHAGCTAESPADAMYSECGCLDAGGDLAVVEGKCSSGCDAFVPFLVVLFFAMFATFANNVPATQVVLGATQIRHRPVALAVQSITYRVLGFIPGPLLFGWAFDRSCRLEEKKCLGTESTGSCWEYDTDELRLKMLLLAIIPKMCSMLFFGLSYLAYRRSPAALAEMPPSAGASPETSQLGGSSEAVAMRETEVVAVRSGADDEEEEDDDDVVAKDESEVARPGISARRLTDSELGAARLPSSDADLDGGSDDA